MSFSGKVQKLLLNIKGVPNMTGTPFIFKTIGGITPEPPV